MKQTAFLILAAVLAVLVFHESMLLAPVIACIALAYVPWLLSKGRDINDWIQRHPLRITATMGSAFVLLTALGITGSSWQWLAQGSASQSVLFKGSATHVFEKRLIRSDEYIVSTPSVLAQWNHVPRFPIINDNLGIEGQNMGVIGMTGVPIAQPAALARPATWGYFFLPLRQAMAWHWQLPFFACLFFFWQALNLLRPSKSGLNLLLSLTFCVAPYAVGWSLWPLYAAFFPLALFVAAASMLRTQQLAKALPLGLAVGLLLAGWALVLYPPWQITVGTFMAFMVVGWAADHWSSVRFRKVQILGISLAILVAAALLASWWLDTADAVAKIQATVYPGTRTAQQGGDLPLFWALRGYTNPETLAFTTVLKNPSEASSYFLLPLPCLLLGIWLATRTSCYRWTLRACMGFVAFWLVFRFAGMPLWLVKTTLWGRVPTERLDLALGLAFTVLLALMNGRWQLPRGWRTRQAISFGCMGLCVTLASAWLVVMEFRAVLPGLVHFFSPVLWALVLAIGFGTWWMMRGRIYAAACMLLLLSLMTTLDFNPLSFAPRSVELSAPSTALASNDNHPGHLVRTLVVNGRSRIPMMLAAAGVPVVNGVLYYPQRTFWEKIGLPEQDWPKVNRYQHLMFELAHLPQGQDFKVQNAIDAVLVTIDPQRFNFANTGAERVAITEEAAKELRSNPSLIELGHDGDIFWFTVNGRHGNASTPPCFIHHCL